MLPVQPYRPGKYPPGPQWAQFGDDLLGRTFSVADEARANLAEKRRSMGGFHMGRLEEDGFLPMQSKVPHIFATHDFASVKDPEEEFVEGFDLSDWRPHHLPHNDFETPSEATASEPPSPRELALQTPVPDTPPGSPRQGALGRVARAGFQIVGEGGQQLAQYMGTSLQNNLAATADYAKTGLQVAGQVAKVAKNASKRAASVGAEHAMGVITSAASGAHQAAQPGSNTRKVLANVAHTTASAAQTAASTTKTVAGVVAQGAQTIGPPVAYGASAAAHALGTGTYHGAAFTGKHLKNAAYAAADVTSTHVVPAVKHGWTLGKELASHALNAATLSAVDIIDALGKLEKEEPYSAYNAIGNGHYEALGNGQSRRSRADSPKNRKIHKAQEPYPTQGGAKGYVQRGDHRQHGTGYETYATAEDWATEKPSKAYLVDQLYKRPGWDSFIKHSNTKELKKKLHAMSLIDLGRILVKLDNM